MAGGAETPHIAAPPAIARLAAQIDVNQDVGVSRTSRKARLKR